MKKHLFTLVSILSLFLILGMSHKIKAQEIREVETYGIHIVKYNLSGGQENQLTHDGTPVKEKTNDLERLANIQYVITRMSKTQRNTYIKAQGDEEFSQTVTTNSQGEAKLTALTRGVYQVVEVKNERVISPMSPVLVSLPMQGPEGQINEVYIYPKSSLVLPDTPQTPDNHLPDKLPSTSGNINSYYVILGILSMVIIVGFGGLWLTRNKLY